MTWTLIILLMGGFTAPTNTVVKSVPGWTSQLTCETAADEFTQKYKPQYEARCTREPIPAEALIIPRPQ